MLRRQSCMKPQSLLNSCQSKNREKRKLWLPVFGGNNILENSFIQGFLFSLHGLSFVSDLSWNICIYILSDAFIIEYNVLQSNNQTTMQTRSVVTLISIYTPWTFSHFLMVISTIVKLEKYSKILFFSFTNKNNWKVVMYSGPFSQSSTNCLLKVSKDAEWEDVELITK